MDDIKPNKPKKKICKIIFINYYITTLICLNVDILINILTLNYEKHFETRRENRSGF